MNILKNAEFINYIDFIKNNDILLKDPVISFYDGQKFKIIPLKNIGKNNIIHTYAFIKNDENEIKKIKVSITICPKAFNPITYEGHLYYDKPINGFMILKNKKDKFYQFNGNYVDSKNKTNINKWETYFDTLYNTIVKLSNHFEPVYLNNKTENNIDINNIIYGIKYYSSSVSDSKTIHFIPRTNDIDTQKNGFKDFYIKWNNDISHHISFIHYTYKNIWLHFYKKSIEV